MRAMLSPMITGMVYSTVFPRGSLSPTLYLQLMATTLPSSLTFSRASAATDIINGVVTSFSAGQPRISTYNGLLMEQLRTNTIYNTGTYTTTFGTVTTGISDPAGGSTARLLTAAPSAAEKLITYPSGSANNVLSGQSNVMSAFVKAGTSDRVQLLTNTTATSNYANFYLNGVGSVSQSTDANCGIIALANGWYRIWMKFTAAATASCVPEVYAIKTGTEARAGAITYDGSETFNVCFFQMEVGDGVSSYIPTTTASVSRADDQCYMSLSGIYNPNAGTLMFDTFVNALSQNQKHGTINDTSQSNMINFIMNTALVHTGGVLQANLGVTGITLPGASRFAIAYATNDMIACRNGNLSGADTSCTPPTGTMRLTIGTDYRTNREQLSGYIASVSYWNVRKTNAELIQLTSSGFGSGYSGGFS